MCHVRPCSRWRCFSQALGLVRSCSALRAGESKEAKREVLEKERQVRRLQQFRFQKELFESQARKYAHADVERLEEYMEQLYEEDLAQKVAGLGMIAQLFRKGPNLPVLLGNNALLQLLARTFREAAKRSMDLAISVVSVFFTISNFSCFHELVVGNQVGAMTIDLVQLEVQRTVMRTQEAGISPVDVAQKVRLAFNRSKHAPGLLLHELCGDGAAAPASRSAAAFTASEHASGCVQLNEVSEGTAELTAAEAKTVSAVKKQDRLLYLAFYLLLNLAEDVSVEHKMQRRGIVPQLIEMLNRCNVELLILAVTFLKRLSVYRENKEQMIKVRLRASRCESSASPHRCKKRGRGMCARVQHDIIAKLAKFVPTVSPVLMMAVLRLLHNLSFDAALRQNIVDAGLVAKLVDLMQEPRCALLPLRVVVYTCTCA